MKNLSSVLRQKLKDRKFAENKYSVFIVNTKNQAFLFNFL